MSRREEDQKEEEEVIDFEFSTGTTEDGVGLKYVNWVATGLKPVPGEGRRPTNIPENSPFVDARVRTATNDYVGEAIPDLAHYDTQVPIWVSADLRQTLSTAECDEIRSRNQSKLVCEIIRRRGNADGVDLGMYNTGHLVAISLMGGYVDFNLFPQKRHLNRGNRLEEISTWHYWCGIESLIRRYLRTERRNPHVEFQARLWYDNAMMPDLPSRISYSVRFLRISGEEDDETKEVVQTIRTLLSSAVTVANYNDARDFDNNARERISENQESTPASTSRASGSDAGGATPPQSQDRNRDTLSYLVWHLVPVVGTYRTLKEGFEDIADGNAASGGGKLVLGVIVAGVEYGILMILADQARRMMVPWGEPLKELNFAKKAGESFLCACLLQFAKLNLINGPF